MARQKRAHKASLKTATKRKGTPQTNLNSLANLPPHQFKPGQSGNPGGRPKLLSDAYKQFLAQVADPASGLTNAELIALSMGNQAAAGDVSAAKELRSATEGDKLTLATWQTEIVDALKAGKLTAQDVIESIGLDEARALLVAAGAPLPESASEPGAGRSGPSSDSVAPPGAA